MTRSRAFLALSAAITVGLGFFSGMAVSRHAKAPPRGHVYIVGDSVFLDIAALDTLRASADHITTNDLGWTLLQSGIWTNQPSAVRSVQHICSCTRRRSPIPPSAAEERSRFCEN
jgi:hypothetical protein